MTTEDMSTRVADTFARDSSGVSSPAGVPQITPEARRYAVKELARRAAVPKSFFDQWQIATTESQTTITFGPNSHARIYFPHQSQAAQRPATPTEIPVARRGWLSNHGHNGAHSDLLLPFCNASQNGQPLYARCFDGSLTCQGDLLASIALILSRVEETLDAPRDEHGRFTAASSIACREHFLDRPILDEHGLAFQQAISFLLPAWQPEARTLRLALTHDIDDVGVPFEWRTAAAHALKRHRPSAMFRDFLANVSSIEPFELALVRRLAAISRSRGLHSSFFWKASRRTAHDSGYDASHQKVRRVIEDLRKQNFEMGVHPGYDTFSNRENLAREVNTLKSAILENSPGGRQHYLRWCPQTWLDWESCGLRYDSSVGFADQFGFRAGTSFPYRPWCWEQNRELDLIEIPLVLMDCTPVKYMRLTLEEGVDRIHALVRTVAQTGGVFSLLWHNTPLMDPDYQSWYENILDLLTTAKSYQAPQSAACLW